MILEVTWDILGTLYFGLSQLHGHGSWIVCEVALRALEHHTQAAPWQIEVQFCNRWALELRVK